MYMVSHLDKRVMGIEPISAAWKADNLPLIHTRIPKLRDQLWQEHRVSVECFDTTYDYGRITGFEPVFSESQSDTLTD